jgi:hypothetical protein
MCNSCISKDLAKVAAYELYRVSQSGRYLDCRVQRKRETVENGEESGSPIDILIYNRFDRSHQGVDSSV